VVPELVRLNPGNLVVMDMDELLDDNGRLLGLDITSPTAAPIWPAYNALWLRITELIRRSGLPVLLLSPAFPAELPEGRWLHLDCPDAVRRKRLAGRGWLPVQIEEALADAAELRKYVPRSVRSDVSPERVARNILDWIRGERFGKPLSLWGRLRS
jgi:hypothetical protein